MNSKEVKLNYCDSYFLHSTNITHFFVFQFPFQISKWQFKSQSPAIPKYQSIFLTLHGSIREYVRYFSVRYFSDISAVVNQHQTKLPFTHQHCANTGSLQVRSSSLWLFGLHFYINICHVTYCCRHNYMKQPMLLSVGKRSTVSVVDIKESIRAFD